MKYLVWLSLLVCIVRLYAMEEEQPFLCDDLVFLIQKMVLIQNRKEVFFDLAEHHLSRNHAEFDTSDGNNKRRLSNIQLKYDLAQQRSLFLFNGSHNELVLKLDNDHEVDFFDGPNDGDVIATNLGCYSYVLKKGEMQEAESSNDKKKRRQCWCPNCDVVYEIIKPTFVEYPIVDHQKRIGAVAIYKKSNLIAVAYDNSEKQKIMLYMLNENNEMQRSAEFEILLEKIAGYVKKISFLTDRTLLALTTEGMLVSLALRKGNKITMHIQSIYDSEQKIVKVCDFAVDPYRPRQMLMKLENRKLVFGDLVEHAYKPLLHGIDTEMMKFYRDTVAYKERGSDQLTIFDLILVKHYMLPRLLTQP